MFKNTQKLVPLDYRKLIKIFEIEGFRISRRKGDHISLVKARVNRPLVIKCSPKKVCVTHIRTNMATAGMSRERFFELLKHV